MNAKLVLTCLIGKNEIATKIVNPSNEENKWRPSLLEELVDMRDGRSTSDLSNAEVQYMIELISTE